MAARTNRNKTIKQKHWENHISSWRESGLNQRQYCLRHGIAISTFSYWIRKFRTESIKCNSSRFYPLAVQPNPASTDKQNPHTGVRLSLCNDKFKIDLEREFSGTTLKKLIATLETI